MNYSRITPDILDKRISELPEVVKQTLNSEEIFRAIETITKNHYFDEERTLIAHQLVALVFLGLLSRENFSSELETYAYINHDHALALVKEIDEKVFSSRKELIEKIYEPIPEITITKSLDITKKPNKTPASQTIIPGEQPLVIHQEAPGITESKKHLSFLSSLPFKIFESSAGTPEEVKGIKVKIQTPTTKKEEEKVIHYSEFRTPLTPYNREEKTKPIEKPLPSLPLTESSQKLSDFMKNIDRK